MKRIFCVTRKKYKEFKIPKISYIHYKILLVFKNIDEKKKLFYCRNYELQIGIPRSPIGLKICEITTGIKKYKSIIKKKRKKHDKIVLLAKDKSSTM